MIVRHKKRDSQIQDNRKKHEYRNLGWLIGEEVDIRPYNLTQGGMPIRTVVVEEYPNTILLELTFKHGKYKRLVSKALLYCGDVSIKHKESDRTIKGEEVIISEQQKTRNSF